MKKENEYINDFKNKFGAIILKDCTESYLEFTNEINKLDRFIALLFFANKYVNIPTNLVETRCISADILENHESKRFKDLADLVRNGYFDYWFFIYTYEDFCGQFFYARAVDNLNIYLKNILEEIVNKHPTILESIKIKNISYAKINKIKECFKEIKIELCLDDNMLWFDEIVKNRNLIVHNRGIVSEEYLKTFPNSKFQVGEEILFSYQDISNFYVKLTNFVASLDIRLAQEFSLDLKNNHK